MKVREHEPEGFEELWQVWRPHARKTDGRGKARPTYRKWLLEGAEPRDMIDGARWHLRSMSERDRPYINLLSVYLNSERWVDECEQERAYQARMSSPPPENVVPIKASLPDSHFSVRWQRGEFKQSVGE